MKIKTCFVEAFKFAKFNGAVKEKDNKAKVKAARLLAEKRKLAHEPGHIDPKVNPGNTPKSVPAKPVNPPKV